MSRRKEFVEILRKSGSATNFEVEFLDKNLQTINCQVNAVFWYDKDGKLGGVESIARNVTDRVKLERKQKKILSTSKMCVLYYLFCYLFSTQH